MEATALWLHSKGVNNAIIIRDIIRLSTHTVQINGVAIADHAATPHGKYNTPEYSKVANRYDCDYHYQLLQLAPDWTNELD